MDETLVSFGSEIKVLDETPDAVKIGGWAVIFDSHDASRLRDKFTKSTDFDIENGETRSLYYNHGLDGTIKKTRLGRATLELKDAGVWYEGEIKKRTDYLKQHAAKIIEGVKAGLFGTSTGAPAHLVERKSIAGGHEVTLWPLSEISITPTPAEPLTSCVSLKSLLELEADDAIKKYDPRQPRDDLGRWTDGPTGGISIGHALHVAKHEGIAEEHHAGIEEGIRSGKLATREAVLAHIDSIHGKQGTSGPTASTPASVSASSGDDMSLSQKLGYLRHLQTIDLFPSDRQRALLNDAEVVEHMRKVEQEKRDASNATFDKLRQKDKELSTQRANKEDAQQKQIYSQFKDNEPVAVINGWHIHHDEKGGQYVITNPRAFSHEDFYISDAATLKEAKNEARRGGHIIEAYPASDKELEDFKRKKNEARKSYDEYEDSDTPETKQLTDLETGLHDGLDFTSHSTKVLAANEELLERIQSLADMRCVKSNRRWSAEKYELLTDAAAKFADMAGELKAIADAHAPRREPAPDALKALAAIELTKARLNGVPV